MYEQAIKKMALLASQPETVERSIAYVESHMRTFLKKGEKVLICFPNDKGTIGDIMEQAVLRCDCFPMLWGEDRRWKTLLRKAFSTKCNAIIGPPLMILGLTKIARAMGTPLFIRNVVLAGYPCMDWMIDGIQHGLDCKIWGCYDPGIGAMVGGFSCGKSRGVHLRSDEYSVELVDHTGRGVPEGTLGEVVMYPKSDPSIRFHTGDEARLTRQVCQCGCTEPRLLDIDACKGVDESLSHLGEELHKWTSILDCRLAKAGYGLELEMVVFPGEKLPKLPSCAKLLVRPWNPDVDEPFPHMFVMKNRLFPAD